MPKLIDYPRTTYAGAWELAEVIDDTGGKCAIETAARKLNRKVSGSFKAIIGSAVKFGLLTSKRDLLTTTTLFKRVKHAYDKQEELLFHREAFLTPPLFTQLCRKFRSRELPVQMLDVMLIREFGVEEINAQGVAKAFVEGCRMVGLLDERNIIADIDALAAQQSPRRELASPRPNVNTFRGDQIQVIDNQDINSFEPQEHSETLTFSDSTTALESHSSAQLSGPVAAQRPAASLTQPTGPDAIASLFGLLGTSSPLATERTTTEPARPPAEELPITKPAPFAMLPTQPQVTSPGPTGQLVVNPTAYQIQVSGPGVNTTLSITEEEDITIAIALLEKIRRQLKA